MKITGYAHSVIGSRSQNQDSFLVNNELGLFAVADGVGGGYKGDVASQMATQGLLKYEGLGSLKTIIEKLQHEILHEALSTIGEALMGTTLTAVRFNGNEMSVAHVGDSRCYLFEDPLLKLITEDHEVYDESLQGTVLASYLGLAPEVATLRIQEEKVTVEPGNKILLCSDGLYRQMEENRIKELIKRHEGNPEEFLESICQEASRAQSSDNVTVVYIEVA